MNLEKRNNNYNQINSKYFQEKIGWIQLYLFFHKSILSEKYELDKSNNEYIQISKKYL